MLRTVMTACIAMTLVLGSDLLWAQEADSERPPSESSPTDSAPTDKSPVGADSDRDEDKTKTDPFDYEASEQISEDLSVSFPVDI